MPWHVAKSIANEGVTLADMPWHVPTTGSAFLKLVALVCCLLLLGDGEFLAGADAAAFDAVGTLECLDGGAVALGYAFEGVA